MKNTNKEISNWLVYTSMVKKQLNITLHITYCVLNKVSYHCTMTYLNNQHVCFQTKNTSNDKTPR